MTNTTTITCLECDHEHEIEIIRGETEFEDFAECPDACESCGASFDTPDFDDRRSERRQMGIDY